MTAASPVSGAPKPKSLPPFPVVAPSGSSRSAPPIPNVQSQDEALASEAPEPVPARRGNRAALVAVLAVVVLGGGYVGWRHFLATAAAPPPSSAKAPSVKAAKPPAVASPQPVPAATAIAAPTPSDTLNKLAHAPVNAINKAQDAIAARRASGQTRVDAAAIGEELPDSPKPPAAAVPANSASAKTKVAPGLSATTALEAAAEANPAFRTFVANAKVSGVFQGTPARAMINGRLMRAGETVDNALGIVFDGIDADRRNLVFKDKSGAVVARRF